MESGGKFIATQGKEEMTSALDVDPAAKPEAVDFPAAGGARLMVAVYTLDGDTLRVCWADNDQRSKAVAGGKGLTVATYKRKK